MANDIPPTTTEPTSTPGPSTTPAPSTPVLDIATARRLAVEVDVDPRSIRREHAHAWEGAWRSRHAWCARPARPRQGRPFAESTVEAMTGRTAENLGPFAPVVDAIADRVCRAPPAASSALRPDDFVESKVVPLLEEVVGPQRGSHISDVRGRAEESRQGRRRRSSLRTTTESRAEERGAD